MNKIVVTWDGDALDETGHLSDDVSVRARLSLQQFLDDDHTFGHHQFYSIAIQSSSLFNYSILCCSKYNQSGPGFICIYRIYRP